MSAATDSKYRQGWADGKADRDPDPVELAYGSRVEALGGDDTDIGSSGDG
jgi:hypothetical protein